MMMMIFGLYGAVRIVAFDCAARPSYFVEDVMLPFYSNFSL